MDAEQADGLTVEFDEGGAAHDQRPGLGQSRQVRVVQPVGQVGGDAGRAVDDENVREGGERVDGLFRGLVENVVQARVATSVPTPRAMLTTTRATRVGCWAR